MPSPSGRPERCDLSVSTGRSFGDEDIWTGWSAPTPSTTTERDPIGGWSSKRWRRLSSPRWDHWGLSPSVDGTYSAASSMNTRSPPDEPEYWHPSRSQANPSEDVAGWLFPAEHRVGLHSPLLNAVSR